MAETNLPLGSLDCGLCRWFERFDITEPPATGQANPPDWAPESPLVELFGYCRRFPPLSTEEAQKAQPPVVHETLDWCAEFREIDDDNGSGSVARVKIAPGPP